MGVVGMGKLTALKVASLIKQAVPGLTLDGDGLYLQIKQPSGISWIYRYSLAGRTRDMGLGPCHSVTLAEARIKAAEARKLKASGIDPLEQRDQERQQARQQQEQKRMAQQHAKARAVSFEQVAADYIEAHRMGWRNQKHAQQWTNTLTTYAYPVIGVLPACLITTDHILGILTPIWTVKPETASRVRNRLELVLDAAKARGLREGENPARWRGHLDKLLPPRAKVREVKSHAAMPWAEVPAFMQRLTQIEGMGARALELTLLTACRSSEVLLADWHEFDLEHGIWIIPASRMKAGRELRVPLSEAALSVLYQLPRISGSAWVFAGARHGKPLSNMAMTLVMRRMGLGHFTVHGFRSSFRDWAAENTHYPREVCELALAHRVATGAEAAYWRGDVLDKRRELMQDWGRFVSQI